MTDSSTTVLITIIPEESPSIENFDPSDLIFEYGDLHTQKKSFHNVKYKIQLNSDLIKKLITHPSCIFSDKFLRKNFELKQTFLIAYKILYYTYLQYDVFLMGSSPAYFSPLIQEVLSLLYELCGKEKLCYDEPPKDDVSSQLMNLIHENLMRINEFNEQMKNDDKLRYFNSCMEKQVVMSFGSQIPFFKNQRLIQFKINQLILQYFLIIIKFQGQSASAKELFTEIVGGYLSVLDAKGAQSQYVLLEYLNQLQIGSMIVSRFAALKQQVLNLSIIASGIENAATLNVSNNDELDISQRNYLATSKQPRFLQPQVCSLDKYMNQIFLNHTPHNNMTPSTFGSFAHGVEKVKDSTEENVVITQQQDKKAMREREKKQF